MSAPPAAVSTRPARRLSERFAAGVVWLRYVVVAGWLALAAATLALPSISEAGGSDLGGLIPLDSPAIQTELRALDTFGYPLSSRTIVVQRDPGGLSVYTQAEAVLRASALNLGSYEDFGLVLGALPVVNTLRVVPSSSEDGTTVLTYLFLSPTTGFETQQETAQRFVREHVAGPEEHVIGVTGSIPARAQQGRLVRDALPTVEIATVLAIVLLVGLSFRSVVAPCVALLTAGVAFLVTTRVAASLGGLVGVSIPAELEPLIVALLLGVVTDYAIFFLSALRRRLAAGEPRLSAARSATADFAGIVVAAGLTVAAGTASLVVAKSELFRAFGPGMAITVLTGLAVSTTLVPALLALLGDKALWPSRPSRPDALQAPASPDARPGRTIRLITAPRSALAVALACVVALTVVALPLRNLELSVGFVPSLPASDPVRQAADAAGKGFSPGILAPTTLLLEGDGVVAERPAIERLERLIEQQPGVAGVFGPADQVTPAVLGVVLARGGDAARMLVVFDAEPLGATAIDRLRDLRAALPGLMRAADLSGVTASFAGDTALAEGIVTSTERDLTRIALAALVVNLLLLMLFLRAVVAPLYLLATSCLALAAALGLTTFVFQDVLGHDGITFYVPFAVAVLLVALGSDYNIFGVGHVWEEARHRSLREAVAVAVPQSARAITAAGVTLAASFGMLALVPLRPFQEIAFAMSIGILLDAVVIRSLLVPSLLVLVGRVSGWPGGRLRA